MVRLTKEEREALTKESSLWEAYRLARSHLPRSRAHVLVGLGLGITSALAAWLTEAPASAIGDRVRDFSSMGFQFAYGVVGILVAGFAIYTGVALSNLAPGLAKAKNRNTGLSELKTLGLHFVEIFVPFLGFIGLHLLVSAFGWQRGPAYTAAAWLSSLAGADMVRPLAVAMLGFVLGSLAYLATGLWVFVFNVYASFMMMGRANVTLTTKVESTNEASRGGEASDTAEVPSVPASPVRVADAPPRVAPSTDPITTDDEDETDRSDRRRH